MDWGDSAGNGELKQLKWRRIKNWSWVKLEVDGTEKVELLSEMDAGRQWYWVLGGAGCWWCWVLRGAGC